MREGLQVVCAACQIERVTVEKGDHPESARGLGRWPDKLLLMSKHWGAIMPYTNPDDPFLSVPPNKVY
jgi:hypothetical protein